MEVNYVDGKTHGLYQQWYEYGELELEVNYVDGQIIP
jgi:antitoxin component YwqK of YwqJK toxin-antitoxin module